MSQVAPTSIQYSLLRNAETWFTNGRLLTSDPQTGRSADGQDWTLGHQSRMTAFHP